MKPVEDLSKVQSFVQAAFKAFNYTWEHPRVANWLKTAEARGSQHKGWDMTWVRKPGVSIAHSIPPEFYRMLAICLVKEIYHGEEEIQDMISFLMAEREMRAKPDPTTNEPALMQSLANAPEPENRQLFTQLQLNLIAPGTPTRRAA